MQDRSSGNASTAPSSNHKAKAEAALVGDDVLELATSHDSTLLGIMDNDRSRFLLKGICKDAKMQGGKPNSTQSLQEMPAAQASCHVCRRGTRTEEAKSEQRYQRQAQ